MTFNHRTAPLISGNSYPLIALSCFSHSNHRILSCSKCGNSISRYSKLVKIYFKIYSKQFYSSRIASRIILSVSITPRYRQTKNVPGIFSPTRLKYNDYSIIYHFTTSYSFLRIFTTAMVSKAQQALCFYTLVTM